MLVQCTISSGFFLTSPFTVCIHAWNCLKVSQAAISILTLQPPLSPSSPSASFLVPPTSDFLLPFPPSLSPLSQGRPQLPNISGCSLLLPLKRDPPNRQKEHEHTTAPLLRQAIFLFLSTSGTNCFIILGSSKKQNSYHTASALPKPSLVSAWEDVETRLALCVHAGADLVS